MPFDAMEQRPFKGRRLTKYERVHVLGVRTEQLARGAQPLIQPPAGASMLEIAELELAEGKLPLVVSRNICDGTHENIALAE